MSISIKGVYYWTHSIKQAGEPPVCLGYKKEENGKIPKSVMESLSKEPVVKFETTGDCFYNIGLTQFSGKMLRTLCFPSSIFVFGVQKEFKNL